MNVVGVNIKSLRESQELTQSELTARCNLLEWDISRGTLAKIEAGVRRVTDIEVVLLAKSLNVEIVDLFPQQSR